MKGVFKMKRFIVVAAILIGMFFASNVMASWTLTGSIVQYGKNNWVATVLATCDGSASGALDLFSSTITGIDKNDLQNINGGFLMSVSVIPGTAAVAPDAAYDVNVYDSAGTQTIDATTTSASSKHTYPTNAGAVATTQQILGSIPFDIGDIGTTGDQVTLKFNIYK